MTRCAMACALTLMSMSSHAQAYVEAGFTFAKGSLSLEGAKIEASPQMFRGTVGYELQKNVAVEGMASFSLGKERTTLNGQSIPGFKVTVDSLYGLYVKPKFSFAPKGEAYARIGVSQVYGTASFRSGSTSVEASVDDSGLSYGVGLSYQFDKALAFNLDYMSFLKKDDVTVNGFTIGLSVKF